MTRVILHADLNNFYASVECLRHPELRDGPLAVCGDPEQRHGIVLAKNYPAKAYGVSTGEAVWQAKQKCPGLRLVKPDMPTYLRFAQGVRQIYRRYTDWIEPFGLDEAWLDLSDCGSLEAGRDLADRIRRDIAFEWGITASVGVADNKVFAKLGSDMKKPDATTVLFPSQYRQKVWRLPVGELLYIGPATRRKLYNLGLYTIGDLAQADAALLSGLLGKWGLTLHRYANGLDASPVARDGARDPVQSIGNSTTTPRDLTTCQEVRITLQALCESVAARLREGGFRARTLQLGVRDKQLFWLTRQCKLESPSCLAEELFEAAYGLFVKHYRWEQPIRSLGVRADDLLSRESAVQLDLFCRQAKRLRQEALETTVDGLRKRFGYYALQRASQLSDPSLGRLNPKDDHVAYPGGYSPMSAEVKRRDL